MKKKLIAISYAYARRERARIMSELSALGLKEAFELQRIYKTPRGFLEAWKRRSKKARWALFNGYYRVSKMRDMLIRTGASKEAVEHYNKKTDYAFSVYDAFKKNFIHKETKK